MGRETEFKLLPNTTDLTPVLPKLLEIFDVTVKQVVAHWNAHVLMD